MKAQKMFYLSIIMIILTFFALKVAVYGQATHLTEVVQAHVLLGLSYAKIDDHVNAIIEFEKALKLNPEFKFHRSEVGEFYLNLGMIYVMDYELDGSLKFFFRAKHLLPESEVVKNAIALVYSLKAEELMDQGNLAMAQTYYLKAKNIQPEFDPENAYKCLSKHCCF